MIIMTYGEAVKSGMVDVYYNNEHFMTVNPLLLNKQQAWHNLEQIKDAHILKRIIYEEIMEETRPAKLKELALNLTELEFHLQELWGFEKNEMFHRFWEYPKCTCPALDNFDAYPHRQYISTTCPLHGS